MEVRMQSRTAKEWIVSRLSSSRLRVSNGDVASVSFPTLVMMGGYLSKNSSYLGNRMVVKSYPSFYPMTCYNQLSTLAEERFKDAISESSSQYPINPKISIFHNFLPFCIALLNHSYMICFKIQTKYYLISYSKCLQNSVCQQLLIKKIKFSVSNLK